MSVENGEFRPASGPETWEFAVLLGAVRTRFLDAKRENPKLLAAGYRAFTVDSTKRRVPDVLAWFNLADNLKRNTLVEAEVIELGVPVTKPDIDSPVAYTDPGHAYFMLNRRDESLVESLVIDSQTADEKLFGERPILQGALAKILVYDVVPVRKISS